MQKMLTIDSRDGGNGDIWMRLISFYTFSALVPNLKFRIIIPIFFNNLAKDIFGERLIIVSHAEKIDLTYSNLGMIDLIKHIIRGKKFISPYQKAVIFDKKEIKIKDILNLIIFCIADKLGPVQVPNKKWISKYQGYLDVIGIKKLRNITYFMYTEQLTKDFDQLFNKLNGNIPISESLTIPEALKDNVLIFPNGTSRQFIPLWWAVKYMPNAYYSFFFKDPDAKQFIENGLKVVYFYEEPGDIVKLAQNAKWTISTDSFPSDLLQFSNRNCTIALTEVLKSRVISPTFEGKVVNSIASCHPCLKLERKGNKLCSAGYESCINWKDDKYTNDLIEIN